MHTLLQKYFAQRVKNLFNHLHDFELNGDDVSMHDFRVEMKKLRSVIKFLREVYPKQKLKKAAHLLRSIFQDAGEIREYQLLQQWLQKNELNVIEQVYFPADKLHVMIEKFRDHAHDYKADLKEIIGHAEKFIEGTNEILPEQYVVDLNAQLEKMSQKNLIHTEWHELRKIIKQWMYAINWTEQEEGEETDKAFSYYNKLQELIGQWHDFEMIKDELSRKQIYLSQDIEVQKDFSRGWDKLMLSFKQKEKAVEEMLARQTVNE